MKNFSSFHRQLNLYDFERMGGFCPSSCGKCAYRHKHFRRNQPEGASLMRPTRIKGVNSVASRARLTKAAAAANKTDNKPEKSNENKV